MHLGVVVQLGQGIEFFKGGRVGLPSLPSTDWLYGWHAPPALLDGGHTWISAAAKSRARFLLPEPSALSFLWWIAAGPERADLLRDATSRAAYVCFDADLYRTLFPAFVAVARSPGVRGNARILLAWIR